MGIMEIIDKANYYSSSNEKKGWSVEINTEVIESNPNIITPEIAEETKADIQPKGSFPNDKLINNYDNKKMKLENILDAIIMTKQDNMDYGRSK